MVEVENKLLKVVPAEFKVDARHWLILHGRYICTAGKPKCGACIIEDLCEFNENTELLFILSNSEIYLFFGDSPLSQDNNSMTYL